jgi:pectin methylesterase-like acyl-CoA thioesterase
MHKMGFFRHSLFVLSFSLAVIASHFDRGLCQTTGIQDLAACPPRTIVVGPTGSFKTIQSAVRSIPNGADKITILIQPGVYREQVNITRTGPLTLLGVTATPNDPSKNKVTILWKQATGTKETGSKDNAFTSSLTVAPTLDSSLTGSGPSGHAVAAGTKFGNEDFRAYNIDFVNDFKSHSAGPSLAISVSYANAGFYYCGIKSYQDTVRYHVS